LWSGAAKLRALGSTNILVNTSKPLSNLRILAKEGSRFFKYAKVDLLDGGNGLLIYDYCSREKLSRHSDGRQFARVPGVAGGPDPTTSVPFSQIRREVVKEVAIPSNATERMSTYSGDAKKCFVFSSTVLSSNGTFTAEVVDSAELQPVLDAWKNHPEYVSAQTHRPTGTGKTVVLTILNKRR
jgi:hypothetical protein